MKAYKILLTLSLPFFTLACSGISTSAGFLGNSVTFGEVRKKGNSSGVIEYNVKDKSRKDLEEWNPIVTADMDGQALINLCIRDHQCEDGDVLKVNVNRRTIFNEELFNGWSCKVVNANVGRNIISVLAVNGTGKKGNCSYANANTGQIRVSGINSDGSTQLGQTQEWHLRDSAGSRSTIEVSVK